VNSINIMSENQTAKVGIVSAEDGSIKVVVFSAPESPPLLGAKASGAKNAPAEDVTVAESGASIKEFPVEEPAPPSTTHSGTTANPKTTTNATPKGSVSAFGWLSWPKLCWHNVLCTVFICLIAASASGGAFSGSFVLAMRSLSPLVPLSFAHAVTASQWGIILDCGSSGTRARVFSWPEKGWSITEADVELEIEPGISSFANNPEALTAYLAPLLDQARLAVPDPSTTKVRAFGTAGMRLLSEMEQVPIWSAVEAAITASGFEFAAAHTIAGGYEGLFNWLTNKYVLQTTLGKDVFLGCLDYGGASFQVTFAPASGVIQDFGYRLRVDSSQERVYSYSYMRSGQDQAMLRYAKALASRSQESPILDSPCHNQGFNFSMNVAGAGERTLRGTGDYSKCKELTQALLNQQNECLLEPCAAQGVYQPPPTGVKFWARGALFFTANGLGLVDWGDAKALSTNQISAKGAEFCAKPWADVASKYSQSFCFSSAYIVAMLIQRVCLSAQ